MSSINQLVYQSMVLLNNSALIPTQADHNYALNTNSNSSLSVWPGHISISNKTDLLIIEKAESLTK